MPPKQRPIRMESKSALAAMQRLETRSDDELHAETRFRSAAQAILGARAAERYDANKAREHFRAAIAAARPQERLQLRRMAEASLALAERRAGDLKVAAEKLGQTLPSGGLDPALSIFWGFLLVAVVIAVLAVVGRRRQKRNREKAAAARADSV